MGNPGAGDGVFKNQRKPRVYFCLVNGSLENPQTKPCSLNKIILLS